MAGIDIFINASTGDIDLSNNTMRLTDTIEELSRQRLNITLKTYKGEWVFDINQGVPWLENSNNSIQLLSKAGDGLIDFYVTNAILGKEEVISLLSYERTFNESDRSLSIDFTANTLGGEITSSVPI